MDLVLDLYSDLQARTVSECPLIRVMLICNHKKTPVPNTIRSQRRLAVLEFPLKVLERLS
jgi:hypothetical protein